MGNGNDEQGGWCDNLQIIYYIILYYIIIHLLFSYIFILNYLDKEHCKHLLWSLATIS